MTPHQRLLSHSHSRDCDESAADTQDSMTETERLPVTKEILRDLHLLLLTRRLQRVFVDLGDGPMQRTRDKDQLEARNILDRWLLSFQLDYRGRMSPDLPIFPLQGLSLSDGANLKLIDECLEKQFSASRRNAERIARVLIETVGSFRDEVDRRVQLELQASQPATSVALWERSGAADGQLRIGVRYASPRCPRIWFLTKNFGLYPTVTMMLRYETLGTGSLQWGDPVTVHHALYDAMGVRNEGFASPLNSKLLGKPGAAFCSLFKDTDAVFGSLGDFFSVDFDQRVGGWTVNPPFIEELMDRVADKLIAYLDRGTGSSWFFVTFPRWDDSPGWQKLAASPHLRRQLDLSPRRFTVQDSYGVVLCPKNTLSIFALGQIPDCWSSDYEAIEKCFLNVDVDSVESAWRKHCFMKMNK